MSLIGEPIADPIDVNALLHDCQRLHRQSENVVTPARFERATYRLGIWRSILLSYGAVDPNDTGRCQAGLGRIDIRHRRSMRRMP